MRTSQIKKWRRDLHSWDPSAAGGEAAQPLVAELPPPPPLPPLPPADADGAPAAATAPVQVQIFVC